VYPGDIGALGKNGFLRLFAPPLDLLAAQGAGVADKLDDTILMETARVGLTDG
jgi:hypothetical protein